jgi:hypothetical protein
VALVFFSLKYGSDCHIVADTAVLSMPKLAGRFDVNGTDLDT